MRVLRAGESCSRCVGSPFLWVLHLLHFTLDPEPPRHGALSILCHLLFGQQLPQPPKGQKQDPGKGLGGRVDSYVTEARLLTSLSLACLILKMG